MTPFFELIGIATCIITAGCLIILASNAIASGMTVLKRKKEIKHRFDKPPTANCYCVDCQRHGEDGRCYKFDGWMTGDSWFCWDAEPKKGENKS